MKGNPFTGVSYFFEGLKLILKPGIRAYFLAPLIVNTLLFGFLIYFSIQQFSSWSDYALSLIPDWLSFLEWLLWPLFILLLLFLVLYSFTLIANLIASPFYGLLAEQVENHLDSEADAIPFQWQALLKVIARSLWREIAKIAYYIPLALLLLLLSIIPGINAFSVPLWFLFGCWMMAIQYCDYPADNNTCSFAQLKKILRQQRLTSLGFGAITLIASMIPFVNLLAMPAAVCGATVYWVRELKNEPSNIDRI